MKRFIHIILILLVGLVSCQKAPFLTFTGQRNLSFKDNGGTETITFSCNNAWTVSSSANWLKVSPSQGSANEQGVKVTITCEANTTYDPRTGTVTIMSEGITETISVSQDTNYGLQSEPTTFNLTNAAQNIEVEVKANVEYTITIDDAGKDWISQAGTKALSATKLTFSIAANEGYDDREGKITISPKGNTSVQPQVITVKQSQTNGLFITTPEYELSNEAHDLTIEVKANVEYEVTSEVDWVKYEPSATKALTTSSFTLKVEKNESYDTRVGTVKVKGGGLEGVITITQAENLGLFVSPTEKSITKDAQEVEVEVNANVEYDIIVPEEAKGMITTIKKQGGGDTKALTATKYLFGVSENTKYMGREASITFKQKEGALCGTIKIIQNQVDIVFSEQDNIKLDWEGTPLDNDDFLLTVYNNVDYDIAFPDWIEQLQCWTSEDVNTGLTKKSYLLKVQPNNDEDREDNIKLLWNNEGVPTETLIKVFQSAASLLNGNYNCYIISREGTFVFDVKKYENATRAFILWNENGKDDITDVTLTNGWVCFKKPKFNKGNAVISITNGDTVLWSWHIWSTDQPNYVRCLSSNYGDYGVMDRNLGATSTEPNNPDSYGLLYSYNNPNPFPGGKYPDFVITETPSVPEGWYVADGYGFYVANEKPDPSKPMMSCASVDKYARSSYWGYDTSTYSPCPENNKIVPSECMQLLIDFDGPLNCENGYKNENGLFFAAGGYGVPYKSDKCEYTLYNLGKYGCYWGDMIWNSAAVDGYSFTFADDYCRVFYHEGHNHLSVRTMKPLNY